jgi:hypothetical protein
VTTIVERPEPLSRAQGWVELLVTGGTFVLIAGIMTGPGGFGLIPAELAAAFRPLLVFVVGWLGFILGFQLSLRTVATIPRTSWLVGGAQSLATMLVLFAILLPVRLLTGGNLGEIELIALFAMCISVSSPIGVALIRRRRLRTRGMLWLELVASIDNVVALGAALFLGSFLTWQANELDGSGFFVKVGLTIGIGLFMGLPIEAFFRSKATRDELMLLGLGTIAFAAGVAVYLRLSPLLVCFFLGFFLRNTLNPHIRPFEDLIFRMERPIYLLLLFLLGAASTQVPDMRVLALVVLALLVRAAAKMVLGRYLLRRLPEGYEFVVRPGVTLLIQGGLALALAVDAALRLPGDVGSELVVATALMVAVNDLVALPLLHRSARQALQQKGATP